MSELDRLNGKYRAVAGLYRDSHARADAERLRAIRSRIAELVAAERGQTYPAKQSKAASSSRARAKRRAAKRLDEERAEWERWRYQRSKLPKGERGPMIEVGQRQCRTPMCLKAFTPTNRRQRYCCRPCYFKHRAAQGFVLQYEYSKHRQGSNHPRVDKQSEKLGSASGFVDPSQRRQTFRGDQFAPEDS